MSVIRVLFGPSFSIKFFCNNLPDYFLIVRTIWFLTLFSARETSSQDQGIFDEFVSLLTSNKKVWYRYSNVCSLQFCRRITLYRTVKPYGGSKSSTQLKQLLENQYNICRLLYKKKGNINNKSLYFLLFLTFFYSSVSKEFFL